MKTYLRGLAAAAVVATLAYGGATGAASASPVTCPEVPDVRVFTLDTNPDATCLYHGNGALTGNSDDLFLNSVEGTGFEFLTKGERIGETSDFEIEKSAEIWTDNSGVLTITFDVGSDNRSGSFSISSTLGSFWQFAIGFAAGANLDPQHAVFLLPLGVTEGTWSIQPDQGGALSHVALYGNPTVIPLPVPVVLLGSALMGLGFFGWRRRRTIAA